MAHRFGLGRGLDALIPQKKADDIIEPVKKETTTQTTAKKVAAKNTTKPAVHESDTGLKYVSVDVIDPNRYQPRTEFSEEELNQLADSIKTYGVLQPLVVRVSGNRYELIAGERRLRASKRAGIAEVPIVIRPDVKHVDALALALIENLQRSDLNIVEEAHSYQQFADEFEYTQDQIAKAVGKRRATISNILRVLQLPAQIQAALAEDTISLGHAKAILSLTDVRKQLDLFARITEDKLTVRQAEAAAKVITVGAFTRAKPAAKKPSVKAFEESLRKKFGTKASVTEKDGTGSVTLFFYSKEEFDTLRKKLEK